MRGERRASYAASLVHQAFCRATDLVEREMSSLISYEGGWEEEYITKRLCQAVLPEVQYAPFNRQQEGRVGADYLWWWVDRSGECFGCLIQAKNIKRSGRRWQIDFQHPRKAPGAQLRNLFRTADELGLPAGFMLYAGDRGFRAAMDCDALHVGRTACYEREGAAVTLVPALAAEREMYLAKATPWYPDRSAVNVFCEWATPLIEITAPRSYGAGDLYRALSLSDADHRLRSFLETDQIGVREVARHIFDAVARMAEGEFAAPVMPDLIDSAADAVFSRVPDVQGGFSEPYMKHWLRGLRRKLPDYVERSLAGSPPPELAEKVDGIVLVEV